MREVTYAMRFTGQATTAGPDGQVLTAATDAPSTRVSSTVGSEGLAGQIEAIAGGAATFTSEVTFTSATAFQEVGAITFGAGNVVRFTTIGSGHLDASPDPTRKHGAVVWNVEGGEGQFAGVRGLITSNFFVGAQLEIVDHHFGVLFLPERDGA